MTQMVLSDPHLGPLVLECDQGYIVPGFDIGAPEYRAVERANALSDGVEDDTHYLGARAVSVTVALDHRIGDPQILYDNLARYCSPRRRPTLEWTIPGSVHVRALTGLSSRGVPLPIQGPKYHTVVAQWKAPYGKIESPDEQCVMLNPSADTEVGRPYDEDYADGGRGPYPFSAGVGSRIVQNLGNELADWRLAIYGPAVNPEFRVNGMVMDFNVNGGLTLLAGEWVEVNTRQRTILLNGAAADSRYERTNFTSWSWSSMRLQEGQNQIRVAADSGAVSAQFCWRSAWL